MQNVAASWQGQGQPPNKKIKGVSTDSRNIKSGELFFALVGERFDGHKFVQTALDQNPLAVVVNKNWFGKNKKKFAGQPIVTVDDTLQAYQEFARYYGRKFDIPVIAITGSAGKTTTKEFVASVLETQFRVHKSQKSYNNHVGVPITLFGLEKDHEILVAEVGTNHFGELNRLSYLVGPSTCVLTNIGYAHLEFFKSLDGVAKAKMEIFNHAKENRMAIVNGDDAVLARQEFLNSKIVTYGLSKSNVVGTNISCDEAGFYTFKVKNTSIKLSIPGQHNVLNALAAVAVGLEHEVTMENIKKGIERVKPVEKRMQIYKDSKVTVIDDSYNGNPSSCQAALVTASDIKVGTSGRKIAVLGDMLELGEFSKSEHRNLAEYVKESGVDTLFLYGTQTQHTLMRAIEIGFLKFFYYDKMEDLTSTLKNYVRPEDLVLVKGSRSMHMDKVVRELLDHLRKNNKN